MASASRIGQVRISPDNRFLAAQWPQGREPFVLKVLGAEKGEEIITLWTDARPALGFNFRADSKRLATAHRQTLTVWDLPSGKEVYSVPTGDVSNLVFSPDGKYLAGVELSGHNEHWLRLWDAATGKEARAWKSIGRPGTLAFSSDSELLADASSDRILRICRVHDDQPVQVLRIQVGGVAFAPKSHRLATWGASEKDLKIWDPLTGRELLTLRGHDPRVSLAAFDDNGLLTSVDGKANVRLFDGRPWQDPIPQGNVPAKRD